MTDSNTAQPGRSAFVRLRPLEVAAALTVIWSVGVAAGVSALQQGRFSLVPVYAAFMLYLTMLSLPVVMPGRDSGLFNPVVFFVLCHGLMALLRTDAALASGVLHEHRALPHLDQAALDACVAKSFILESLALAGLYIGYSLLPYVRFRKLPVVRAKALRLKAVLWVGLSGLAVLVLVSMAGGIGGLLLQRGMARADRIGTEIGAHWHFLAGIGTVVPVIWLAFRPAALRTLLYWCVTLSSLLFVFGARGSRSSVLTVLILMGITWTLRTRKIPYKVVFAGVALSVVLLGALGEFRKATRHQEDISDVTVESDVSGALESGIEDLSSRGTEDNGQIAVIGRVPSEVGYLWGRSYFSIPLVAVPSALIGPKPPTAGTLNAQLVHERTDTAIPAGAVGEAYFNFGYPGPFVVFCVYGTILKCIAAFYLRNRDNPVVVSLYVFVLFRFLPGSDPFYDFTHAMVPAVAFLLFVVFPFGLGQRRRVRRAPLVPRPRLGGAEAS